MRSWYVLLLVAGISTLSAQGVEDLLHKADELEQEGQVDSAIEVLRKVEQASKENPQVVKRLARNYCRKIEDCLDPDDRRRYAQLSLDLAKDAAQRMPDDAQARIGLAAAYGKMIEMVDSKLRVEYSKRLYREVSRGLQLDPNNDFGHVILARWNFEMSSLNPLMKGFAQVVYGEFPTASREAAIHHFERAIELAPDRILHHAEYAKVLDAWGEKSASLREWSKVTQLRPSGSQDERYRIMALQALRRG
jgi:tetratricopeptide (TPR) repeat protein